MSQSTGQSGAAAFFASLRPSVRGDVVGASWRATWMPGTAWDGVRVLFEASDDVHARQGLCAFLVELADHIDETAWHALVLAIARELEQTDEPADSGQTDG